MTTPSKIYALINAVKYLIKNNIPGDMVECGVWKGGSIMAVAKTLQQLDQTDRHLYLFDTFEGMTKPAEVDVTIQGKKATAKFDDVRTSDDSSDWCYASLKEVKDTILSTGYNRDMLHFVKGKVEDTLPENAPEVISLLRLDTDWYESTLHELIHLYPRLSQGGVLIIDDYDQWLGAREAVDEYIDKNNIPILLNKMEFGGRIGIKI